MSSVRLIISSVVHRPRRNPARVSGRSGLIKGSNRARTRQFKASNLKRNHEREIVRQLLRFSLLSVL